MSAPPPPTPPDPMINIVASLDQLATYNREVWGRIIQDFEDELVSRKVGRQIIDECVPIMFEHILGQTKGAK